MVIHGYQKNKLTRYRCKECRKTFNERTGTPLTKLRKPMCTVIEAIQMHCAGMAIADIARIKGVTEKTVKKWIWRVFAQCLKFNRHFLRRIRSVFTQFDELWAFAKSKRKRHWIWTCIDVLTRLFIAFVIGARDKKAARKMCRLVRSRLEANPLLITSDGLEGYVESIPEIFSHSFYAQVVKVYRKNRVVKVKVKTVNGLKKRIEQIIRDLGTGKTVNCAFIERLNLTLRHCVPCLGRRVLFFAKNLLELIGRLHVFQAFYNFIRPHTSLQGKTPAMAAGLADHIWSWYELLTCKIR